MRFMTVNAPILQQFLWREWQRRGVFAWILWPLSRIFWIVMTARRASFSAGWRRTFRSAQPVMIVGNLTDGGEVGDEPLLIAQRTGAPVWVCPDRAAAARALCDAHPEINLIISDDGLQHYQLARDVELAVFDERLGGNGWLLPAGPLREPLARARDATLVHAHAARPS